MHTGVAKLSCRRKLEHDLLLRVTAPPRQADGVAEQVCRRKLEHAFFHRDMQWDKPIARQAPSYCSKGIT